MVAKSLPNITYKVTYREITQRDLAVRAWGEEWAENDHDVYEWSNGRDFDSTDKGVTGLYASATTVIDSIILQNFYPDAPAHLVQQGKDADGKATKWKIRFQQSPRPQTPTLLDIFGNPFVLGTSKLG
jgi:hypothetical protein